MLESLSPFIASLGGYETYALALLGMWGVFGLGRRVREKSAAKTKAEAASEPPSLHPVINPALCIGCGACTHACPEGGILGMISGKAQLLDPGACIGHGACQKSCPVGAIDLVFGTARRGVDIPVVSPNFESNVPGLYIAGELGGMGLIANAIEQGRQAMAAIAQRPDLGNPEAYDVVVVGAGPAGIAASLGAKEKGLTCLTLEQDTLAGTVARYPRGKLVMTRPATLPLFGRIKLRRVRKERLLELWHDVVTKTGVKIHQGVCVEKITPTPAGFEVATTAGVTNARTVLLATGRRGSPRRLGVPGEHLSKVVYSLADPAQYAGAHVLVVGGGDSALEAIAELARQPVASLTLSYRGTTFERANPANRRRLDEAVLAGRVAVLKASHVASIEPTRVIVDQRGRRHTPRNDAVIICAGGVLPTALLADIGIDVVRKFGTA